MARKIQTRVGNPLDTEFKNMVHEKILANFPLKLEHTTNANNIFGTNVAGLRGKSVRTKPTWVEREYIPIPRAFYVLHKFLTLTADMMFVNGLLFLINLSRTIKNFTTKYIPNQTSAQLIRSLNKTVKLYSRNRFFVNIVMMDMKIEKVSDNIGNT